LRLIRALQAHSPRWPGTYVRSWRERLNDEYRQPSTLDRALEYGRQAVELDPYMAEAHAQLAYVLHWQYRRGEALREFERALSSTRISPTAAMDSC
jgi:tetratricopeptide (TPR) repeat protein